MLHIGKYFGYIFNGAGAILFYPFQARKYLKNKDKYSFEERFDFVKTKAHKVLNKYLKVKLNVKGLEKINSDDTYLFVPNHQAMLDPVVLIDILPKKTIFVSKKETMKYPIIGKYISMIDGIFLDRENIRDALNMVNKCKEHLNNGNNVVIFPEGTRSKDKDISIQTYKPGAFKCAYSTNVKIIPVIIDKSYILLSTKMKNTDKVINVKFMDPINSDEYKNLTTSQLAEKIEDIAKLELENLRKI